MTTPENEIRLANSNLQDRSNEPSRADREATFHNVCKDKDQTQERYGPRHHDLMGASAPGYLTVTPGRSAEAGEPGC